MIQFLTDHLKLRHRIYAGYISAGVIVLVIIALTYWIFSKTTQDFRDFVLFSDKSQINLQLTAQIADIHRQALIYTHEGHRSAADQVTSIYKELLGRIDQRLQESQPQTRPNLAAIRLHLENYHLAFLQVKQQRDLRHKLINIEFRNNASEIERLINQLIEQSSDSVSTQIMLRDILNALLSVEKNVFRYLDSLDANYVISAKQNLSKVFEGLNAIDKRGESTQTIVKQTVDKLEQYEQSFIEGIQHTRGYLYLINVVMAAEAYEILYQAKKLSSLITEFSDLKEQTIFARMNDAFNWLIVFAVCLLFLLIAFSYCIGKSIARPIAHLTKTFRELAQGSSAARIPKYRIPDEIGDLTRAATAFRNKNTQTEKLLQESVELTQALEKNKQNLEQSNAELAQFVYTVSHDLKSPLVTSMGFIGITRKLASQGRYELAFEKLDTVVKSIQRMEQLINDLLELSRVGRTDMDRSSIDLNGLLGQFAASQNERLSDRGFSLIVKPGLPVIHGNESRILQLFENILSNAVKYAHNPEQGGKLEIGSVPSSGYSLIYCRDNGPGIAPEFHEKIFGLFYRLNTAQEGTGIGLAIAKRVMQLHGGDIWIESSPGNGSTFWLKFPGKNQEMGS